MTSLSNIGDGQLTPRGGTLLVSVRCEPKRPTFNAVLRKKSKTASQTETG
jgi:hypothetical protein